jgi:glycosyltransferase involved in cell wall biosynthesis
MRVLWFTNAPMPAVNDRMGRANVGSGYWMSSLLEHLIRTPGLALDIVTAHPGLRDDRFVQDGVTYFVIGQPRFQSIFSCRESDLRECVKIVLRQDPDLIHVHGSERFYGLIGARKLAPHPCVVSLQGFLAPCLNAFFGSLSPGDFWRSLRLVETATRRGLLWRYWDYRAGVRQEEEILAGNTSFIGHTHWDRMYLHSRNPAARYHYVQDMLRRPFYAARWDIAGCERYSILFTNIGEPRRGTEVLLRALPLLRREFPAARLRLAGEFRERRGYDRFLLRAIAEAGLSEAVDFLGYLDANAMAHELCRTNVFAIPSYIENGSNALCEAMLVGAPCVAAYTSGILSNVEHGHTGLLFPPGDAVLLAESIARLFRDDDLAGRLGRAARAAASERHAPQRVISQLLNAYQHVITESQQQHGRQAVSQA